MYARGVGAVCFLVVVLVLAWPELVELGVELGAAAASPVDAELPAPELPPAVVPLDDPELDGDEPELTDGFVEWVTFGCDAVGTVTVEPPGGVTWGTVTVTDDPDDALLVTGSTANAAINPRVAATLATTHRPRRRDDVKFLPPFLPPSPVRALSLPGIVAEL